MPDRRPVLRFTALTVLLAVVAFGPVAARQGELPVPMADLVEAYGQGDLWRLPEFLRELRRALR